MPVSFDAGILLFFALKVFKYLFQTVVTKSPLLFYRS